jgi:hypothetical protein
MNAAAWRIKDPGVFGSCCTSLVLGSIALILSGRVLILLLRRNPNVSISTKGTFVVSPAFCDIESDGGTAAG